MSVLSGAVRVVGGKHLSAHLAKEAFIPATSRGLVCTDLVNMIAELAAGANIARTLRPLWHVHVDPALDARAIPVFWQLFESEFGLQNARYVGQMHSKGCRADHEHRVYDITRNDGSVTDLSFERMRREKLVAIVAWHLRLSLPPIPHLRAVARTLRREGHPEMARWVEGHPRAHEAPPIAIRSPADRQAEERTSASKADIAAHVLSAWEQSDDGPSFQHALTARGLILATGEKTTVVVDQEGIAWSLSRVLGVSSRLAGARINAATVKSRIKGLVLPSRDRIVPKQSVSGVTTLKIAVSDRICRLKNSQEKFSRHLTDLESVKPPPEPESLRQKRAASMAAKDALRIATELSYAADSKLDKLVTSIPIGIWAWISGRKRRHLDEVVVCRLRAEGAAEKKTAKGIIWRGAVRRQEKAEGEHVIAIRRFQAEKAKRKEEILTRLKWLSDALRVIERDPDLETASNEELIGAVERIRASRSSYPRAPSYRPR